MNLFFRRNLIFILKLKKIFYFWQIIFSMKNLFLMIIFSMINYFLLIK